MLLTKLFILLAGTALAALPYRELYEQLQDLRRRQTKLSRPRQSTVPLVPFYAVPEQRMCSVLVRFREALQVPLDKSPYCVLYPTFSQLSGVKS